MKCHSYHLQDDLKQISIFILIAHISYYEILAPGIPKVFFTYITKVFPCTKQPVYSTVLGSGMRHSWREQPWKV